MTPTNFPEANIHFGKPPDWDESQCGAMPGFRGTITNGTLDGQPVVITAWQPDESDIARIVAGAPVFLMICGECLPPHAIATQFPT